MQRQSLPTPAAFGLLAVSAGAIAHGLYETQWLRYVVALTLATTIAAIWATTTRKIRWLGAAFLIMTVPVMWLGGKEARSLEGVISAAEVLALLLALQRLAKAVSAGGFTNVIRSVLERAPLGPLPLALLGGYVLSWILLLTSIPVVFAAVADQDSPPLTEATSDTVAGDLGILLARAFGAAAVATPVMPTVLIAIAVTGVSPMAFLAAAVPLSLLLLPLSLVGLAPTWRSSTQRMRVQDPPEPASLGSPVRGYLLLTGLFVSVGGAVIGLARLPVSILAALAAALLVVSVVWEKIGRHFLRGDEAFFALPFFEWVDEQVEKMADSVLLIGTGGVFGYAITAIPAVEDVAGRLGGLEPPIALLVLSIIVVIGLRLLGVSPAVTLLIIGPMLVRTLPISEIALAVLLSGSSIMAFLLSPLSATSAVVSSLTGMSPLDAGITRQAPYVLLGTMLTIIYVLLLV